MSPLPEDRATSNTSAPASEPVAHPGGSSPDKRGRAAIREVLAGLFFFSLSVLMTWPLALHLSSAVSDPGDPWLLAWTLEWDVRGMLSSPGTLFHPPIFHDAPWALAFSENVLGIALLTLPLHAMGADPILVYNICVLLGFALSGYGAWVLARMVTGSIPAALLGGVFYAFVPYRFDQLSHLQHVWGGVIPLLIAATLWYSRRPGWTAAVWVGAAFLFNGLINIHWLLFGSFAAVASLLLLAAIRGTLLKVRFWIPVATALFVSSLLLLPVLIPYEKMSEHYGVQRGKGEAGVYSATWTDWLAPSSRNKLYGSFEIVSATPAERFLFPGLLAFLLLGSCLAAVRRNDLPAGGYPASSRELSLPKAPPAYLRISEKRILRILDVLTVIGVILTYVAITDSIRWVVDGQERFSMDSPGTPGMATVLFLLLRWWIRYPSSWKGGSIRETIAHSRFPVGVWVALLLVVIGVLGSLGMNSFFHQFLFEKVGPFRGLRVPARWAMIAYTGLAVLVATGLLPFLRRPRRARVLVGVFAITLMLYELRAAPILWYLTPSQPEVYGWLADVPVSGAVLELPIGSEAVDSQPYVWTEVGYVLGNAYHHKPLVNGFSGFEPPLHQRIATLANAEHISDELFGLLEQIGTSLIVVHADRLGPAHDATRDWLERGLDSGRLVFLRRFQHDMSGDYLFAIVANERNIGLLRGDWESDIAGRTQLDNMRIFLAGEGRTYNAGAFGTFDVLRNHDELKGPAKIHGWVLSADGVSAVNLRFQNGAVVIPTELVHRQDVKDVYPWYPLVEKPGFHVELPGRPPGVKRQTDLQLEIIDDQGRSIRLAPLALTWKVR